MFGIAQQRVVEGVGFGELFFFARRLGADATNTCAEASEGVREVTISARLGGAPEGSGKLQPPRRQGPSRDAGHGVEENHSKRRRPNQIQRWPSGRRQRKAGNDDLAPQMTVSPIVDRLWSSLQWSPCRRETLRSPWCPCECSHDRVRRRCDKALLALVRRRKALRSLRPHRMV